MLIPYEDISSEALRNLASSVVLRDGTDYGEVEVSFEEKVDALIAQIKIGNAVILYSEAEDEVDIISKEAFQEHLIQE